MYIHRRPTKETVIIAPSVLKLPDGPRGHFRITSQMITDTTVDIHYLERAIRARAEELGQMLAMTVEDDPSDGSILVSWCPAYIKKDTE